MCLLGTVSADKNRNRDVFCIFWGQENGNVRIHTPRIVVL